MAVFFRRRFCSGGGGRVILDTLSSYFSLPSFIRLHLFPHSHSYSFSFFFFSPLLSSSSFRHAYPSFSFFFFFPFFPAYFSLFSPYSYHPSAISQFPSPSPPPIRFRSLFLSPSCSSYFFALLSSFLPWGKRWNSESRPRRLDTPTDDGKQQDEAPL